MTAIIARNPLQSLPTAMNRPTTRRRSQQNAFGDDDAPAAKRPRTEVNGAGRKTNGAAKPSAKAAYNENADGFQFTRRTSRRTTRSQHATEPIPEEPAKPAPAPARRKKSLDAPEPPESGPQKRRRSARLSGDSENLEPTKPVAKVAKKSAPPERRRKEVTPGVAQRETSSAPVVQTPKHGDLHVAKKRNGGGTKVMLPFADTPVIARNKEMRKASQEGHRRSSTGLRGRRASSLIDSGLSIALPHSDVEIGDFYKYIEDGLMEQRRMAQLLSWCSSRALLEKPSGDVKDGNAIMAARAMQEELINEFGSKPELSNWFDREETVPTTVVKKSNPVNERNQATLKELEDEVQRLEEELAAWEAIASSSSQPPPPAPSIPTPFPTLSDIDVSLLDPSQAAILSALQSQSLPKPSEPAQPPSGPFTFTTPEALGTHLSQLSLSLEPNIDLLADGLHKVEQYRITAERVADRVLGTAAQRLEERDKQGKEMAGSEGIGIGDVLKGLAGVLNE
ncbi:uncharacterized protein EI97DRAFT_37364 [Westerdykella ornata]|uniref:Uncharacterized protein n=1 Tax=Westerdykella ornata TaxID=318751 RepID=A0A6A6JN66_WESOR|nr:uncharacterized protein EI97DRAFT_37364 [Westerdykella ornata]KAF2276369.1 hypothetical protein EI97DRAFT_37364 [Westerdykella ornata]